MESTAQAVTVAAEASGGLNTEETRVQATLDTQQVRDLPLQGRGTLNLVNTAPGVSGYTENTNNFAVEQTPGANANGHYYGGNLYVLDGISITSNITTGTANISPNADSLQEIALQTNTFNIDFAAGAGLTTSVTTKAGSNQFHGTGNFTYTDQNLRAHTYFQKGVIPTISNKDVSATFGGPIIKDRTFFFASVKQLNNKLRAPISSQWKARSSSASRSEHNRSRSAQVCLPSTRWSMEPVALFNCTQLPTSRRSPARHQRATAPRRL